MIELTNAETKLLLGLVYISLGQLNEINPIEPVFKGRKTTVKNGILKLKEKLENNLKNLNDK